MPFDFRAIKAEPRPEPEPKSGFIVMPEAVVAYGPDNVKTVITYHSTSTHQACQALSQAHRNGGISDTDIDVARASLAFAVRNREPDTRYSVNGTRIDTELKLRV